MVLKQHIVRFYCFLPSRQSGKRRWQTVFCTLKLNLKLLCVYSAINVRCLPLDNFHIKRPPARAVVFAKINSLPSSQQKLAVCNNDVLRCTDCACLHMRRRIPFHMAIKRMFPRVRFIKTAHHIPLHIRIGVFVNRNSRGRMRTINNGESFCHPRLADRLFDE